MTSCKNQEHNGANTLKLHGEGRGGGGGGGGKGYNQNEYCGFGPWTNIVPYIFCVLSNDMLNVSAEIFLEDTSTNIKVTQKSSPPNWKE